MIDKASALPDLEVKDFDLENLIIPEGQELYLTIVFTRDRPSPKVDYVTAKFQEEMFDPTILDLDKITPFYKLNDKDVGFLLRRLIEIEFLGGDKVKLTVRQRESDSDHLSDFSIAYEPGLNAACLYFTNIYI